MILRLDPRYSLIRHRYTLIDIRRSQNLLESGKSRLEICAFSWLGKHDFGYIVQINDNGSASLDDIGRTEVPASIIRGWLKTCQEQHGEVCGSQYGGKGDHGLEVTLIDAVDQRLVSFQQNSMPSYLALAYVWGQVEMLRTTKENYENLKQSGALLKYKSDIAQVIQDAMSLVTRIGERYLWVDALCIVQDDDSTKHLQIAQMDLIYQRAVLTIAAISGHDAHSALPGATQHSRPWKPTIEHEDGLILAIKPPSLGSILQHYVHFKRAWTLQEILMSRRVLYFTPHQVYFECKAHEASEVSPEGNPFCPDHLRPTNPIVHFQNAIARKNNSFEWRVVRKSYFDLVTEYTSREISYQGDILNAFAGFQSIYEYHCGGTFHFGLPDFLFDLALLWIPKTVLLCRDAFIMDKRWSDLKFPSWSWTGWVGQVGNSEELLPASSVQSDVKAYSIVDGNSHYPVVRTARKELGVHGDKQFSDGLFYHPRGSLSRLQCPVLVFEAEKILANRFNLSRNTSIRSQHNFSRFILGLADEDSPSSLYENRGRNRGRNRDYKLNILTGTFSESEILGTVFLPPERLLLAFQNSSYSFVRVSRSSRDAVSSYPKDNFCSVNVLLIQRKGEYAERVAVGRVDIEAWKELSLVKQLVRLM